MKDKLNKVMLWIGARKGSEYLLGMYIISTLGQLLFSTPEVIHSMYAGNMMLFVGMFVLIEMEKHGN